VQIIAAGNGFIKQMLVMMATVLSGFDLAQAGPGVGTYYADSHAGGLSDTAPRLATRGSSQ